ncbi:MAG: hypothetical protein HKN21_05690 [Candidatus Eisenbacteria bacterium]|uniref:Zinc-finger domain-containing protein n=1 Tax=Eiseniibacteriota bacterium TaxID=2212470 RepID=A0A7Y2H210_UNCEI|nr:hypothetical protein [Candidatus Eisenbacteria bacterium]
MKPNGWTNQEQHRLIEAYLDSELTDQDRLSFEVLLCSSQSFAEEVVAYESLVHGLETLPQPEPPRYFDGPVLAAVALNRGVEFSPQPDSNLRVLPVPERSPKPKTIAGAKSPTDTFQWLGRGGLALGFSLLFVVKLVASVMALPEQLPRVASALQGLSVQLAEFASGVGEGILGLVEQSLAPFVLALEPVAKGLLLALNTLTPQILMMALLLVVIGCLFLFGFRAKAPGRGVPHVSLSL